MLSCVFPACSFCSHTLCCQSLQPAGDAEGISVSPASTESRGATPEHSSQLRPLPKATPARRRTELESAAWPCPEEKNRFPLLSYPGTVPWVGTSPLESGPAAGTVPLAAAFRKLRNQRSFYSATSAELVSLPLHSLLLLRLLCLELETGQKLLVKLRNCKQKR